MIKHLKLQNISFLNRKLYRKVFLLLDISQLIMLSANEYVNRIVKSNLCVLDS